MFELGFNWETIRIVLTLVILLATLYGLLALLLTGILTPAEAFFISERLPVDVTAFLALFRI